MFRLIGIMVTLLIVGYLYITFTRSGEKALSSNVAVQEQGKVLQQATGVDPNDKKALQDHAMKQAKEIEAYQNQLNQALPQE